MKRENLKKLFYFLVLLILWIVPCFDLIVHSYTYYYFAAFAVSLLIMYLVKNRGAAFFGMAAVTAAVSVYRYEYIFLVLPVVLLMYAHRVLSLEQKQKKKKDDFNLSNIYVTLSYMCIMGEVFYSFVQYSNLAVHKIGNLLTAMKLVPLLIAFFIVLTVKASEKKNYSIIPKADADRYKMLYIASLTGLAASLLSYHCLNDYASQSLRTEYLFWFMYIMTIAVNEDPFLKNALKGINRFFEKTDKNDK